MENSAELLVCRNNVRAQTRRLSPTWLEPGLRISRLPPVVINIRASKHAFDPFVPSGIPDVLVYHLDT